MKIYLNWDGPAGKETVDEFEQAPGQTLLKFKEYVREMAYEYHLAGMSVYRSSRPCKNWKERS